MKNAFNQAGQIALMTIGITMIGWSTVKALDTFQEWIDSKI